MNYQVVSLFLILLFGCSYNGGENKGLGNSKDSLSLTKSEYEDLRKSILEDTVFTKIFFEKIPANIEEIKLRKLLETPYEDRVEVSGYSSGQIDSIFYALRISKGIRDKFDSLDKSLPKINGDSDRERTDSLINKMNNLSKELNKTEE